MAITSVTSNSQSIASLATQRYVATDRASSYQAAALAAQPSVQPIASQPRPAEVVSLSPAAIAAIAPVAAPTNANRTQADTSDTGSNDNDKDGDRPAAQSSSQGAADQSTAAASQSDQSNAAAAALQGVASQGGGLGASDLSSPSGVQDVLSRASVAQSQATAKAEPTSEPLVQAAKDDSSPLAAVNTVVAGVVARASSAFPIPLPRNSVWTYTSSK